MGAKARQGIVGADFLYKKGTRRESRQQKPLPQVLAPLQLPVRRLPHFTSPFFFCPMVNGSIRGDGGLPE